MSKKHRISIFLVSFLFMSSNLISAPKLLYSKNGPLSGAVQIPAPLLEDASASARCSGVRGSESIESNGYSPSGKWMVMDQSRNNSEPFEVFIPQINIGTNRNLLNDETGFYSATLFFSRSQLYKKLFIELMLTQYSFKGTNNGK